MTLQPVTSGQRDLQPARALRIVMVTAFGTRKGGYFSDVLLGLLCGDARALGHDARMVRVYYDGTDGAVDADVSARLAQWLVDRQIELVVTDRVLTSEPFAQWKARRPGGQMLLLPPPEGMGPVAAGDAAIGYRPYERRREHGEMGDEVRRAFAMWLASGLTPPPDADIPGLSALRDGQPEPAARPLTAASGGPPLEVRSPSRPRRTRSPVVECEVIAAAWQGAERRGVRDVTWLLETRADWLVEHRAALEKSIEIAARTSTRLELYLVGFESFSDDERSDNPRKLS